MERPAGVVLALQKIALVASGVCNANFSEEAQEAAQGIVALACQEGSNFAEVQQAAPLRTSGQLRAAASVLLVSLQELRTAAFDQTVLEGLEIHGAVLIDALEQCARIQEHTARL